MEKWAYTFEHTTKADWFRQMNADLRSNSRTLETEWWPGELLEAAHHTEDLVRDRISLPAQLFSNPPQIIEYIEIKDSSPSEVNSRILKSLAFGAQHLILGSLIQGNIFFQQWLTGVHQDLIDLSIQVNELKELIHLEIPGNIKIRLTRGDSTPQAFINSIHEHRNDNVSYVYEIHSSGDLLANTIQVFQKLLGDIDTWSAKEHKQSDFISGCIFLLIPDNLYYKQIIHTRVIHLIWNNICMIKSGLEPLANIECHVLPEAVTDPDKYLIIASSRSLAAALTGVQGLCIRHMSMYAPDFYRRVARNIHHLLHLESEIYKGIDPLAGAYSVDVITKRWTNELWKSLTI